MDLNDPRLGDVLDGFERHDKFRGVAASFGQGGVAGEAAAGVVGGELGGGLACGLAELERRNLTLDLPDGPDTALIPRIAERFPALRMIVDHLGPPPADPDTWARDVAAAAQHSQVFGKLSGLITRNPTRWNAGDFRPYVQHALRVFGARRLMFGSDWPSYLPEGTFKEALAAFTQSIGPLPLEVREHLLGGTAARVYRIELPPEGRTEPPTEGRTEPGPAPGARPGA